MRISGGAILIKWWKGPPVLVIVPSERAIQLRTKHARGYPVIQIPRGPIEARTLEEKEKQFLVASGMPRSLVKSGRVLAISREVANRFEGEREAMARLAKRLGLSQRDLMQLTKAKYELNRFRPATYSERKAAQGLRALLGCELPKKPGRPGRVAMHDHSEIHKDADRLRQEGKNIDQVVRTLSQRYSLSYSYTKRILEDRSTAAESTP